MDAWTIGLIVLIVVGLGVIVFGALADRRTNRRRAAAMLAPPARPIPHFSPDAPAPHYLSDLQARRKPTDAPPTELTAAERIEVDAQLTDPSTVRVPVGYASADFVTDTVGGRAILDHPKVLVCADEVQTVRELLAVMEPISLGRTPLVVVAPGIADDVRKTLEVNTIQQTMRLLAVRATGEVLATIARTTRATPSDRATRQSGYLPEHELGTCARWVSTRSESYLIPDAAAITEERNA